MLNFKLAALLQVYSASLRFCILTPSFFRWREFIFCDVRTHTKKQKQKLKALRS
jgi:hypothetical protein